MLWKTFYMSSETFFHVFFNMINPINAYMVPTRIASIILWDKITKKNSSNSNSSKSQCLVSRLHLWSLIFMMTTNDFLFYDIHKNMYLWKMLLLLGRHWIHHYNDSIWFWLTQHCIENIEKIVMTYPIWLTSLVVTMWPQWR